MATIGGGGRLVQPRLIVRGAADAGDEGGLDSSRFEVSPQVFSPALLIELRRGMLQATGQPGGTAYAAFFDSGERVAGKTGTAQAGGGQVDHAWFAGYVPAESPRVAVVVLLEHGGDASERAAPLARRVIDAAVRRF